MSGESQANEVADAVRASSAAKGRSYREAVEAGWLAKEIAEFCNSRGWPNKLHELSRKESWIVLTDDDIAALVERKSGEVIVRVMDAKPVRTKTSLAINGLLALTGMAVVALPLAGATLWRAHARAAQIDAVLQFVDARVQGRPAQPNSCSTGSSVTDRMKDLVALRDQGLITSDEYEAKKREILKAV
jgi:hypothetical protein